MVHHVRNPAADATSPARRPHNLACDLAIALGDFDLVLEMLGPACAKMGRERMEC
jgi:hypothetical protein